MHSAKSFGSIFSYTRWAAPFGGNGVYVKCYLELVVDRNQRVIYKHKDQFVQIANADCGEAARGHASQQTSEGKNPGGPSIWYKSLHVELCGYQDLPVGEEFAMVWNPALEARPNFINELHGPNNSEQILVIAFPESVPLPLLRRLQDRKVDAGRRLALSLIHI